MPCGAPAADPSPPSHYDNVATIIETGDELLREAPHVYDALRAARGNVALRPTYAAWRFSPARRDGGAAVECPFSHTLLVYGATAHERIEAFRVTVGALLASAVAANRSALISIVVCHDVDDSTGPYWRLTCPSWTTPVSVYLTPSASFDAVVDAWRIADAVGAFIVSAPPTDAGRRLVLFTGGDVCRRALNDGVVRAAWLPIADFLAAHLVLLGYRAEAGDAAALDALRQTRTPAQLWYDVGRHCVKARRLESVPTDGAYRYVHLDHAIKTNRVASRVIAVDFDGDGSFCIATMDGTRNLSFSQLYATAHRAPFDVVCLLYDDIRARMTSASI